MSMFWRKIAVAWGLAGLSAVLAFAIWRLGLHTRDAIVYGMTAWQWALMLANVAFMAWAEGYRGFQQRFSPRVAARCLHLQREPVARRQWLAPLFCTGFFDASRRVLAVTWIGTGLIVLAVLLINLLGQPWRGIIDSGVVVGLSWGLVSLLWAAWVTLSQDHYLADPEVPSKQRL